MDARVKVEEIMSTDIVTVKKNETVAKVAKKVLNSEPKCVFVVENHAPIGIVTERDILRTVARNTDLTKTKAGEIMSSPLVTIEPTMDILEASKLMADSKVERLPVMRGNALLGVVTVRDIVSVAPEENRILAEVVRLKTGISIPVTSTTEGECEVCHNYSEYLREVDGRLICEACREEYAE